LKLTKPFLTRVFLFGVGGGLSILGSTQFFRLFHEYFGWGQRLAYAVALAIVTTLLFLWNYFIGFKTDRHWTHAAWRQVACQMGCVALDYLLVTTLIAIIRSHETIIIGVVKVFVAVIVKFALYHYWIYPERVGVKESNQ
jgi:putative flippase GtrA